MRTPRCRSNKRIVYTSVLAPSSDALVTSSFLFLLVRHLFLVASLLLLRPGAPGSVLAPSVIFILSGPSSDGSLVSFVGQQSVRVQNSVKSWAFKARSTHLTCFSRAS